MEGSAERDGAGRGPPFDRTTDLLSQALAGRQRAWNAFYRRYHRLVRRVVTTNAPRWLLAHEEIDDLVLQAMERLVASLRGFRYQGHAQFIAWVRRVAVTTVHERARHYGRKRRPPPFQSLDVEGVTGAPRSDELPGDAPDPQVESARHERRDELSRRLADLRPQDRRLARLFLSLGGDVAAVGRALGITSAAARMRLRRLAVRLARLRHGQRVD